MFQLLSSSVGKIARNSRRSSAASFGKHGTIGGAATTTQQHGQASPAAGGGARMWGGGSRRQLNVVARPSDLIGNTPLIDLTQSILVKHGIDVDKTGVRLVGKLESLGPCSSVKDRLGRSLIDEAEKKGLLTPGKTVLVEPTSGNTGIALAFIARERGYRCILTMPESMSLERRIMLMSLGAEVVLTPKETAVPGALAKAEEIVAGLDGNGYMLQQFENPANPKIHRETTGPEIWRDTDGLVDVLVSGCGTGGTITGISQYIKGSAEHNCAALKPEMQAIAVEPMEQMLITEAKGGQKNWTARSASYSRDGTGIGAESLGLGLNR